MLENKRSTTTAPAMPFTDSEMRGFGFTAWRLMPDGEVWAVAPFSLSNGRLFVGVNPWGYDDFYCFCSYEAALKGLMEFDPATMPEPIGWHRHYGTARRRTDGDPLQEYIHP